MSRPLLHPLLFCLAAVGLPGACGCSHNPQVTGTSVTGVVRYQGKPITGGEIILWGDVKDGNNSAVGTILGDGSYEILNAPIGHCKVVVDTGAVRRQIALLMQMPEAVRAKFPASRSLQTLKYMPIDQKYASQDTTPVEITLEPGKQTKDVDLP